MKPVGERKGLNTSVLEAEGTMTVAARSIEAQKRLRRAGRGNGRGFLANWTVRSEPSSTGREWRADARCQLSTVV